MFAPRATQKNTQTQTPSRAKQTSQVWTPDIDQTGAMPDSTLLLQRYLGNSYVQSMSTRGESQQESMAPPIVHEVLHSPGHPLDPATRALMESRFSRDFSQVRVHTDAPAAESTRAVSARAYTVGRDIVFAAGQYAPETAAGKRLLAHELTHTAQQSQAKASFQEKLYVSLPNDELEIDADQMAVCVVNGTILPEQTISRGISVANRVYRTPEPNSPIIAAGGTTPSGPRIVYIDADVIDQIMRGNKSVVGEMQIMRSKGVEIRIVEPNFIEATRGDNIQARTARGLIIQALGIRRYPGGTLKQRFQIFAEIASKGILLQPKDFPMVAAVKLAGPKGELWTFDQGVQQNAPLAGVTIAPEGKKLKGTFSTNKPNYRVGLDLIGLRHLDISPSGIVTRRVAPGRGGPGTPSSTTPRSTPSGSTPRGGGRDGGAGGRGGTTATVGVPDMTPVQTGGPSARGTAKIGGIELAIQGFGFLLNWVNDEIQERRVREALSRIEPYIRSVRQSDPGKGILLIFFYKQIETRREDIWQPGAIFLNVATATGRTPSEALDEFRNRPRVSEVVGEGLDVRTQMVWIPPIRPARVADLAIPFPRVGFGILIGRESLQNVEWSGVSGFDDIGQTNLNTHVTLRFVILKPPNQINWFNGSILMNTLIDIVQRRTSDGKILDAVDLDPTLLSVGNNTAVPVFPYDDSTAQAFSRTPATRDKLKQLRDLVNLSLVRWVPPENIRTIRGF